MSAAHGRKKKEPKASEPPSLAKSQAPTGWLLLPAEARASTNVSRLVRGADP